MARTNNDRLTAKGASSRLVALAGVGLISAPAWLQESERVKETGAYELVELWPKAVAAPGYVRGLAVWCVRDSPDRIFLLGRGELKLPNTPARGVQRDVGSLGQQAIEPAP